MKEISWMLLFAFPMVNRRRKKPFIGLICWNSNKKKHHPTSHIKLLWAPSRRSSCLTTWPSYGPIHVPGGMGWAAQTPNSAPGTLDLQSLTSSGNIKEGHCGKHRFFFRSVQSERIKITQLTAPEWFCLNALKIQNNCEIFKSPMIPLAMRSEVV